MFAPSGIKTPARPQPAGNGRPAVVGEPFAEEAFAYTREMMMQRDVEVCVGGWVRGRGEEREGKGKGVGKVGRGWRGWGRGRGGFP